MNKYDELITRGKHYLDVPIIGEFINAVEELKDRLTVEEVAQMMYDSYGDKCACNYNGHDEWLPLVCELQEECPYPTDELGCWKQFVKHWGRSNNG